MEEEGTICGCIGVAAGVGAGWPNTKNEARYVDRRPEAPAPASNGIHIE